MSDEHLTFIYIICKKEKGELTGPVKVGITRHLGKRLSTIKTYCPFKPAFYRAFLIPTRDIAQDLEMGFHKVMTKDGAHLHGEWFDMEPEQAVAAMVSNLMAYLKHDGCEDYEIKDFVDWSCNWTERAAQA